MARGFILFKPTGAKASTFLASSTPKLLSSNCKFSLASFYRHLIPLPRFFLCKCSSVKNPIDMFKYKKAFSKRMAIAGLKPHHRIALGVSGGPDSMALCVLTADWKTESGQNGSLIDGLLAIIVDHGLRPESKEEANTVSRRVTKMGIRCEIASCDWMDGKPKQGHLQEEARNMRYLIFQEVCVRHQVSVLLIAHHADDQAELFILRLSRKSGILGLAGMPFTSQIFSTHTHFHDEDSKNNGIFLVRPLLDFVKDDMYEICRGANQDWVEDPSNQSPLFSRNRIRMSLLDMSSCVLKYELCALISACRKTRLYIDNACNSLIDEAVTIMDLGYAVIDLEILNKSRVKDTCLLKFASLIFQFVSQRNRPIRGSSSTLVLDYMRTSPCKTSLTVAGCYLCPAPGSKGTKVLVCCSVDCPLPSGRENFQPLPFHGKCKSNMPEELEQIVSDVKSYADSITPHETDVNFLDVTTDSILNEAAKLNILSESSHRYIDLLQKEELKHFSAEKEIAATFNSKNETFSKKMSGNELLREGEVCNFMNRFFVKWRMREINGQVPCKSCAATHDLEVDIRHMDESDWLYLAEVSKNCLSVENFQTFAASEDQIMTNTKRCSDFMRLSAQRAIHLLKLTPVAARRSLPVLVNRQGILLSIPSISYSCCPFLIASATFKPRVPLGGGHSSFI